jgi:hypothetical protein
MSINVATDMYRFLRNLYRLNINHQKNAINVMKIWLDYLVHLLYSSRELDGVKIEREL